MLMILVVEDDLTQAKMICNSLRQGGLNPITVTTAEAAKVLIKQMEFDAILLDVVLPGQSGFGLCRELKNQDKTRETPIIICSSKTGKIDQAWGLQQGAAAYVTKPVDPQELVQTIKRLIPTGKR